MDDKSVHLFEEDAKIGFVNLEQLALRFERVRLCHDLAWHLIRLLLANVHDADFRPGLGDHLYHALQGLSAGDRHR